MPSLIIVESPGKVKTIQKYLDKSHPNQFIVTSSSGHICNLPKDALGFDTKTFECNYVSESDKQKEIVRTLKKLSSTCDKVVIATDLDREGEAIANHIKRILNLNNPDRIIFNKITPAAILESLANPTKIDMSKVNSQETRRILDRMIGWTASPVVRRYLIPDGSMGRVQTVVVLIAYLREKAIEDFKRIDHFGVELSLLNNDVNPAIPWNVTWDTSTWLKEGEAYFTDKKIATTLAKVKSIKVADIIEDEVEVNPSAPLITSSLQKLASINLKMSPDETMKVAQKLYEAGAITYMRTDSVSMATEAFTELTLFAEKNGLPIVDEQRIFATKGNAQEAHEACRPTSFFLLEVGPANSPEQQLYELIWNKAVASQLKAAKFKTKEVIFEETVEVEIDGQLVKKKAIFKAKSRDLLFKGWKEIGKRDYAETDDPEDEELSLIPKSLKVGDVVDVVDGVVKSKKTAPPTRYTEASLVGELEKCGVGRPATFASSVSTVIDKGYVRIEKRRLHITETGRKLIESTLGHFEFIDIPYTGKMEDVLDQIESGGVDMKGKLAEFWDKLNKEVVKFEEHVLKTLPQVKCELCQSLVLRKSKNTVNKDKKTTIFNYWVCSNESCSARYGDDNGNISSRLIDDATDFTCLECDRKLSYNKGFNNGKAYEHFACIGRKQKVNPCFAKYEILQGPDGLSPDFDAYREKTKHKCLVCKSSVMQFSKKRDDGTVFHFWGCINQTCNVIYADNENSPDFEKYQKNHTHQCRACKGYLQQHKFKDKEGFFWSCENGQAKKNPCKMFLDDLDGAPDYAAYDAKVKLNNTFKCKNGDCNHFLHRYKKRDAEGFIWVCSREACKSFYNDVNSEPDYSEFLKKYTINHTHKCKMPECGTYLTRFKKKDSELFGWICTSETCKKYYDDDPKLKDSELPSPDFAKFNIEFKRDHTHKCINPNGCTGFLRNIVFQKDGERNVYWKCQSCGDNYKDVNELPDFELYKENHTHKCIFCSSYIRKSKTLTGVIRWSCSNFACNVFYENNDGIPNFEIVKETYPRDCPECKGGKLKKIVSTTTKLPMWTCSNNTNCKSFFDDEDGKPVPQKSKAKKK